MPPMASPPVKRKWSDIEDEAAEKQSLMDLCASKLRYVNPPCPPRRRTEVPLLRNVLIVNTMKYLTTEMKTDESTFDYGTEDLTVDPSHFEGLPPLSELLTDIMLDPQPCSSNEQQQSSLSFNWSNTGVSPHYSSLAPLQPTIPSYMDSESSMDTGGEEKIVHDLLPCTSVLGLESSSHSQPWEPSGESKFIDSFSSAPSTQPATSDYLDNIASELAFQSTQSRGPLPSFTSFFESCHSSSSTAGQTDLPQTSPSSQTWTSSPSSATLPSTVGTAFTGASTEEFVGNMNFSDSELEILAMTLSAKWPTLSLDDLVYALPPAQSLVTPQCNAQQSQSSFFVPSSHQAPSASSDSSPTTGTNQCASFCRKDQPPPTVDDTGRVRVLVNL